MLHLENLCKTFYLPGNSKVVADNINQSFEKGKSVGLLGRNGAGKSSLLDMIAGNILPDSGQIRLEGTVSWPVGFAGSFHRELTGAQNTRFLGRVYGVDTDELVDFVEDFSELGAHFRLPFRSYSSGMKSRLAFAISMGIHFDFYLVDEITAVGDAAFKEKSEAVFQNRMETSGALFVSHSMPSIRRVCDHAVVLEDGVLTYFEDVSDGISQYKENMARKEEQAGQSA